MIDYITQHGCSGFSDTPNSLKDERLRILAHIGPTRVSSHVASSVVLPGTVLLPRGGPYSELVVGLKLVVWLNGGQLLILPRTLTSVPSCIPVKHCGQSRLRKEM